MNDTNCASWVNAAGGYVPGDWSGLYRWGYTGGYWHEPGYGFFRF